MSRFGWGDITDAMQEAPVNATQQEILSEAGLKKLAWEEAEQQGLPAIAAEHKAAYDGLIEKAGDEDRVRAAAQGKSMLNPFETGRVKHFSVFFYLIMIFNIFYGGFSWQGSSGYKSAALTAHEQKMGNIIFNFLYMIRLAGIVLIAVGALTFLTHPRFTAESAAARQILTTLEQGETPQLAVQQRVPIALSYMLPTGLRGLFCVMMVFLLLTTQNTYIHSWGTIFIQDVVMPWRRKPLSVAGHVRALRWSIAGVVLFALVFAGCYKPTEFVQMYFAITGAVISGLGAAIIGGLYWRRGSTVGAYAAVSLGAILSISRIVLKQFTEQIAAVPDKGLVLGFIHFVNTEVTSQVVWFWIMILCIVTYALLSLAHRKAPFNLERMLHRGRYDITGEHRPAAAPVRQLWQKLVGITVEFTRTDRFLAVAMVLYNLTWVLLFFGALAYNFLIHPIPQAWWTRFWHVWILIQVVVGAPVAVWFVIGAIGDLRRVFQRLATMERNEDDDGRVMEHHLADEEGAVVDRDDAPGNGAARSE